jgi:hypothetical protein
MKTAAATAMRLGAPGAILLALGFACSAHAEEYLKSYSVTGRADVHVHVDDSSVHILTSDTQQIEFRVTSEGSATFNIGAKLRIDSQQNGNQVELTVLTKPGISIGFSDKRLRTEVRMPKDADLQVETADGSVELALPQDFQANLDASTRDGHISLGLPVAVQGNIGKTEVRGTINGGGPALAIHTGDGSIHIKSI